MALPQRPRSFAERPKANLPKTGMLAANDNADSVLGGWSADGTFRFASPAAQEQWVRRAYQAGINAETWAEGQEVDAHTASLASADLGGPLAATYLGPDGKYRSINPKTIEPKDVRDHRNRHLAGKTMDQLAAAGKLPGEEEWIARWKAANESRPSTRPESGTSDEPRPNLGQRFEASAKAALVDGTIFGSAVQQFRSGHAVSPDVLATRPPDRFLQSGSKGALDWYRMYEPLGIAGGKRRIDFLPPEQRKQWETVWDSLSTEQQAAYRAMWEEKQKDYRPWREQFDLETTMPPPETWTEYLSDIAGSMAGSAASPESWVGTLPKASLNAVRTATSGAARAAVGNAGKMIDTAGNLLPSGQELRKLVNAESGEDLLATASSKAIDLRAELKKAQSKIYSLSEAYNLGEPHQGLIYVKEKATGTQESIEFMKTHPDVIWIEETQEFGVPALRFKTPFPNGKNLIRLDIGSVFGDQMDTVLTDTKTQMAIWSAKTQNKARYTLTRLKIALSQNPGYQIVYEFKTREAAEAAQNFLNDNDFADIVIVKVRGE